MSIANVAPFVTRIEYAEMRGWSPSYITKLVRAKRLVLSKNRKFIAVAASDRLLRETASVDKQGVCDYHASRRQRRPAAPGPDRSVLLSPEGDQDRNAYNGARAKREAALAAMAEMDLCERQARLVEVVQVRNALGPIVGIVSRAFEQIRARIGALWATERDPEKRERLLDHELRASRQELADNVQRLFS